MRFRKDFFEGEIREGFYVEKMIKKVWAAELEVLADIDHVCKKHNIRYYADWGTLLGTVRHHGFVPWDDDMDITMLRDDYEKFWKVAAKDLPKEYAVLNIHTETGWTSMLTRVVNGRKINFSDEHMEKFHGCPYVVGIDIFPLDFMASNEEEDQLQCQMINMVMQTATMFHNWSILDEEHVVSEEALQQDFSEELAAALRGKNGREQKLILDGEKKSILSQIGELCGMQFIQGDEVNQLNKLAEQLCKMYRREEATEVALMPDRAGNFPHYRIPKIWYEQGIEMPFENIQMPVPLHSEKVLKIKYREDFMTPKIIMGGHEYPFYKGQQYMVMKELGFTPR